MALPFFTRIRWVEYKKLRPSFEGRSFLEQCKRYIGFSSVSLHHSKDLLRCPLVTLSASCPSQYCEEP